MTRDVRHTIIYCLLVKFVLEKLVASYLNHHSSFHRVNLEKSKWFSFAYSSVACEACKFNIFQVFKSLQGEWVAGFPGLLKARRNFILNCKTTRRVLFVVITRCSRNYDASNVMLVVNHAVARLILPAPNFPIDESGATFVHSELG